MICETSAETDSAPKSRSIAEFYKLWVVAQTVDVDNSPVWWLSAGRKVGSGVLSFADLDRFFDTTSRDCVDSRGMQDLTDRFRHLVLVWDADLPNKCNRDEFPTHVESSKLPVFSSWKASVNRLAEQFNSVTTRPLSKESRLWFQNTLYNYICSETLNEPMLYIEDEDCEVPTLCAAWAIPDGIFRSVKLYPDTKRVLLFSNSPKHERPWFRLQTTGADGIYFNADGN